MLGRCERRTGFLTTEITEGTEIFVIAWRSFHVAGLSGSSSVIKLTYGEGLR